MADWKEQYLSALRERDEVEKANLELYDYCTRLADQRAALQNQQASWEKRSSLNENQTSSETDASTSTPTSVIPPSIVGRGLMRVVSPPAAAAASYTIPSNATRPTSPSISTTQLRQDLAAAQQERRDLLGRLETATRESETLKTKSQSTTKKIAQLSSLVNQLDQRLRDREEEIRGKAKLVESVQDENVTLNLQLNMSEEKADRLQRENQELVERWMVKMGKEAERMNQESKFG